MLKTQPIEGLRIVDARYEGGGPLVLQVPESLVPEVHQQMTHTAALDPSVLIRLASHLQSQPVEYVTLINL